MDLSMYLQVFFYLTALGAGVAIARRTLLSKTIQAQKDYIEIIEKDRDFYKAGFDRLSKQNDNQEQRIKFLEEMLLRGNPYLVEKGPSMGSRRKRRGNRPADPPTEEDGEV